jgi:hypothetical protein
VPAGTFRETLGSFLRLTGREDVYSSAILGSYGGVRIERPLLEYAEPVGAQRAGWKLRDLLGELLRFSKSLARLGQPLHQPDL